MGLCSPEFFTLILTFNDAVWIEINFSFSSSKQFIHFIHQWLTGKYCNQFMSIQKNEPTKSILEVFNLIVHVLHHSKIGLPVY